MVYISTKSRRGVYIAQVDAHWNASYEFPSSWISFVCRHGEDGSKKEGNYIRVVSVFANFAVVPVCLVK
jgi:hypothetical protein